MKKGNGVIHRLARWFKRECQLHKIIVKTIIIGYIAIHSVHTSTRSQPNQKVALEVKVTYLPLTLSFNLFSSVLVSYMNWDEDTCPLAFNYHENILAHSTNDRSCQLNWELMPVMRDGSF